MATAQQHLTKAKTYVDKGQDYFRKASEEILAAKDADPTLSNREIGRQLGRSHVWVGKLIGWYMSGNPLTTTPFARETATGSWRSPSGGDDEWYTRPEFVKAGRKVLRRHRPGSGVLRGSPRGREGQALLHQGR